MLAVASAMLSALYFASPASAACGSVIFDFVPGLHAISCSYSSGPEETWTVPANITKPRFSVRGAEDEIGGRGGFISAKLPVEAGQILDLKMGGDGAATSVSRGGVPLLVAGGGDGIEPNYLDPEAEPLDVEAPGLPGGSGADDGSVFIEWYDARDPFELTHSLGYVIVDIFDSEKVGFSHTGTFQEWQAPEGVDFALFELFGGEGESGEPRGHILAGLEVDPGEAFDIQVGGEGEDTILVRGGSFEVGVAAGGDTERPNYFPWMASPAEEFWEGGGSESEPGYGYAIVHYWPSEDSTEVVPDDRSAGESQIEHEPLFADLSRKPAPACIVPRLRSRTVAAARRALIRANCTLRKLNRRPARKRMRGRIVSQSPRAGTAITAGSGVNVTVGAP